MKKRALGPLFYFGLGLLGLICRLTPIMCRKKRTNISLIIFLQHLGRIVCLFGDNSKYFIHSNNHYNP